MTGTYDVAPLYGLESDNNERYATASSFAMIKPNKTI